MKKYFLLTMLTLLFAMMSCFYFLDNDQSVSEVTVKKSSIYPWIEVYHNGQLTSEWQPSDGDVYKMLSCILDNDFYVPSYDRRPSINSNDYFYRSHVALANEKNGAREQ